MNVQFPSDPVRLPQQLVKQQLKTKTPAILQQPPTDTVKFSGCCG